MYKYIYVLEDLTVQQDTTEPSQDDLDSAEDGVLSLVRIDMQTGKIEEYTGEWTEVDKYAH